MSGHLTHRLRSSLRGSSPHRLTSTIISFIAGCLLVGPAEAVIINAAANEAAIAGALASAVSGDQIIVAPGTAVITGTLAASNPGVTLSGSGIGSTTLQTSGAGNLLLVTGANFTLEDFTIQKTDLVTANMIAIMASGCTVRDNEIYGVDPITPWSVNGLVIRAMAVSPGLSGLLVQNNYIHHVRQPAYIDAGTGTITGNQVSGTRGWVVAGATLAFSGNTWGPVPSQGADIALLSTCNPLDYPDILALSSSNGNAFVDAQFVGGPDGRADGYVDITAPAPGGNLPGTTALPYTTVQGGVDGTLPGGTVHVAAGAYTEQVLITKNLTVRGAGAGATTIQAPAVLATQFLTGGVNPQKPVVTASGAANVRIEDLKIDGMGNGNANNRLLGIGYWNAGGAIEDVDIVRVRNSPLDGTQAGNGVIAANNTGGPYGLALTNVDVSDFQKNGLTFTGTGLTASVTGGSVNGHGDTNLIAQNGIQFSGGAGGTVNGCAISGLRYTPASVVSVGLLVFGPGSVAASNLVGANAFAGVQVPMYYIDASGTVNGAEVTASSSEWNAIFGYNQSLSAAKTPVLDSRPNMPVASPAEEEDAQAARKGGAELNLSMTLGITNACFTGSGVAGSAAIGMYSAGGPIGIQVLNSTMAGWDYGVAVTGPVSLVANDNSITGNLTAGLDNTTGIAGQDAERNWWGAMSGPSGVGPGSGDAVLGAGVDFNPWRISGVDLGPSCGFQPAANNAVVPGPVPGCISIGNPCITIPVVLNRSDSANLRGYSVDIQLSPELVLCSTPAASVTVGPYLATGAGINGTVFQVVSNGGGSYTVDQAILGVPCGATGSGGTIFNLAVKAAGPGDATGTITVTSVTLRDCDNAPIASVAGAPLNVNIDQTAPTAIASLAATQVKVGNDGDGTTKIDLAWPAVEAGATVEVYRAGYGNYPEYDDPPTPGSVPATPAYPPGGPWVLTSVTTSGGDDEVAWPARDFWYYVAFVKDACGNVSAVSNKTNGTLNYHLGDVSNGFTAGVGDNLVGTVDISLLGANYGLIGLAVTPVNYLDVGPTTNFSVNARPTTDNKIGFEDLIMFAINYGTVSAPGMIADRSFTGVDALAVATEGEVALGGTITARLRLTGTGRIQGLSAALSWNPRAVQPVGYEAGDFVTSANGVVFSPAAGTIDVALLGVREAGFEGEGELATVRFRVIGEGDPQIALGDVIARDASNQPVTLGEPTAVEGALPATTRLLAPMPNPSSSSSLLAFSLAKPGRVDLSVYSVDGRRVRTVLAESREAGFHNVSWDGAADDGRRVPAGVYFVRMTTAEGVRQSRTLTLLGR